MEKLFVDVNVILEILSNREKAYFCIKVLRKYEKLCLSPTSIHIVYYFGKKASLKRTDIQIFLKDFEILTFTHKTYLKAIKICQDSDLEDALQIATALDNGLTTVFSLDKNMIKNYKKYLSFYS